MKVGEAIAILQESDPEADLLVSSDEEGNSYRLASISTEEMFCKQGNEFVGMHPDDVKNGEYAGWEDTFFSAVVVW